MTKIPPLESRELGSNPGPASDQMCDFGKGQTHLSFLSLYPHLYKKREVYNILISKVSNFSKILWDLINEFISNISILRGRETPPFISRGLE